ncbi:MAG: 4-hydroxythreonine-4-phosphate dehydrogenase PdxA [Rhodovulum sp.]|nr:4-hydroxythreonine-4-phosphate dehydrogenase PdxA [Rhodovulum sp.]
MTTATKPVIGITMGDPAGIGPEIVVKALDRPEVRAACRPIVVGDAAILREAAAVAGSSSTIAPVGSVAEAGFRDGTIEVLDLANIARADVVPGQISAACGRAFVEYIRRAARLAMAGEIAAVASAPTNKEAMHAAGQLYPGQTEIFAEETGSSDPFTILTGGKMRVFLVSSHVSLAQAIALVTRERMELVIRKAVAALRDLWGIEKPRLVVAGLNPHAGDGGLFGREEIEHVIPVVERLRGEGLRIDGPGPADSVYHQADQGAYDGLIGMYHDQGVIPLKRYGYVTVIAGTPIIRTTAGHGTAYDIAWKGSARADVMARAVLLAAELAAKRAERAERAASTGARRS